MTATLAKTALGTKLYIGLVNPTSDSSALTAETSWTEVGEVTQIPAFGLKYNKSEHKPIATGQTYKFKGSYDGGSVQLDMAEAPTDAGQAAILTALGSKSAYNFKIEFADAPSGASALNSTRKFMGKVFSFETTVGTVDGIIAARVMIEIDGTPIRTNAAAS